MSLSSDDIREFNAYLAACTDAQVIGVYEKEKEAGRSGYIALAEAEMKKRGLNG